VSTITIELPTEQLEKLTRAAERRGVRAEELLRQLADDGLARIEDFDEAAAYVLRKNAELYRRLAQ
jgi:antitoxin FitA